MPRTVRLLCIALITLVISHAGPVAAETVIGAEEARTKQESGTLTVIDIRRPSEWRDSGVPEGGETISMHDPAGPEAFLANILASVDGDKAAPIGLICASGVRSTWASDFLESQGFTNIFNIKEGMLGRGPAPGWIRRGLPTATYTN